MSDIESKNQIITINKDKFKEGGWYLTIAVQIITGNYLGIAQSICDMLKIDIQNIEKKVKDIYLEVFNITVKKLEINTDKIVLPNIKINLDEMDIRYPTFNSLFYAMVERIRTLLATFRINLLTLRNQFVNEFDKVIQDPEVKAYFERRRQPLLPESQILDHTNKILESVGSTPLPLDNAVTLWQIYVTPSAEFYKYKVKDPTDKSNQENVPDLILHLIARIENLEDNKIIIIHGEPGHGKTSTVRMLVHAIVAKQNYIIKKKPFIILMYEFKQLNNLNRPAYAVLSQQSDFICDEKFFEGKYTVLILDGLDEKQATEDERTLPDFVNNLFILAQKINAIAGSTLKIIITGRTMYLNQLRYSLREDCYIYEIKNFSDIQRDLWLKRYFTAKNLASDTLTIQNFNDYSLSQLVNQPILLTICTIMLLDNQVGILSGLRTLKQLEKFSISEIYKIIINWTFFKKYESLPFVAAIDLNERQFTQLLQSIALLIFQKGENQTIRQSILVSELLDDRRQQTCQLEFLVNKDTAYIEKEIKHVQVLFFFKGKDNVIEFAHKSIQDYLVTEAIVSVIIDIFSNFNHAKPDISCSRIKDEVYAILGKAPLNAASHVPFLYGILKRRNDEALQIIKALITFFTILQEHPYINHETCRLNENPLLTECNVISGLLYIILAIIQENREKETVRDYLKMFKKGTGVEFCRIIGLFDSIERYGFINKKFLFDYIDISDEKINLRALDLRESSFKEANMKSASLNRTSFHGANLYRANLNAADCVGTYFYFTTLEEANLSEANLERADFLSAKMHNAILSKAILKQTNFNGADLRDSNLRDALLIETNMSGADLRGADLTGAKQIDVIWKDAKLDGIIGNIDNNC